MLNILSLLDASVSAASESQSISVSPAPDGSTAAPFLESSGEAAGASFESFLHHPGVASPPIVPIDPQADIETSATGTFPGVKDESASSSNGQPRFRPESVALPSDSNRTDPFFANSQLALTVEDSDTSSPQPGVPNHDDAGSDLPSESTAPSVSVNQTVGDDALPTHTLLPQVHFQFPVLKEAVEPSNKLADLTFQFNQFQEVPVRVEAVNGLPFQTTPDEIVQPAASKSEFVASPVENVDAEWANTQPFEPLSLPESASAVLEAPDHLGSNRPQLQTDALNPSPQQEVPPTRDAKVSHLDVEGLNLKRADYHVSKKEVLDSPAEITAQTQIGVATASFARRSTSGNVNEQSGPEQPSVVGQEVVGEEVISETVEERPDVALDEANQAESFMDSTLEDVEGLEWGDDSAAGFEDLELPATRTVQESRALERPTAGPKVETSPVNSTAPVANLATPSTTEEFSASGIASGEESFGSLEIPSPMEQLTETLQTHFEEHLDVGERREIRLKLHPVELGELEVQVESVEDTIRAKIFATEAVTSEILNRDKEALNNALEDLGISVEDVDIQHRDRDETDGSPPDRERDKPGSGSSGRPLQSDGSGRESKQGITQKASSDNGINLIV